MENERDEKDMHESQEPTQGIPVKERKILNKLLLDEEDYLKRLEETIDKVLEYLRIESQTGKVILNDSVKRLPVHHQIRTLLIGIYFSHKLAILPDDRMTYKEIAYELGRPASGVSSRLSQLVKDGDIGKDEGGRFFVPFHRIDSTLRELRIEKPRTDEEDTSKGVSKAPGSVERKSARRVRAPRKDEDLAAMLSEEKDLSKYSYIKDLKRALETGLAGLLIARDEYGKVGLGCPQIAEFVRTKFPVHIQSEAINMAFLKKRSEYVSVTKRGHRNSYSLLPLGEAYLREQVKEVANQQRIMTESESEKKLE